MSDVLGKNQCCHGQLARSCEICEKDAEIARLQQVARNIYEAWAGSEGIPIPETAVEAYLLRLIEQMRDEAKHGLPNATKLTGGL